MDNVMKLQLQNLTRIAIVAVVGLLINAGSSVAQTIAGADRQAVVFGESRSLTVNNPVSGTTYYWLVREIGMRQLSLSESNAENMARFGSNPATGNTVTFTAPTQTASSIEEEYNVLLLNSAVTSEAEIASATVDSVVLPVIYGLTTITGGDPRNVESGGTLQYGVINPRPQVTYYWHLRNADGTMIDQSLPVSERPTLSAATGSSTTFTAPTLAPGAADVAYLLILTDNSVFVVGFSSPITSGTIIVTAPSPRMSADPNDPIRGPVSEFMHTRSTVLLSRQPNLSRLIRAVDGGVLNFELTEDGLDGEGEFVSGSFWGEFTGSTTNGEDADGGHLFMAYGNHLQLADNFLVGGMVQFDQLEEAYAGGGTLDGSGFLVGPYFIAQPLEEHPFYFSGSVLYGRTDNDIVFFDGAHGRRYGTFDSTRFITNLNVSGEFRLEDLGKTKLIPYVATAYITDESDSFEDNNGVRVLGQAMSLIQAETGLRFSIPVKIAGGEFFLNGGKGLVFSYIDSDSGDEETELRSRVELGYSYEAFEDLFFSLDGFYDGLYVGGYENWGTTINVEKKF